MEIESFEVTVGEVAEDYVNNDENGVRGFGGLLNIRPKYQREFIYKPAQRDEVVRTVLRGLPLNIMYWAEIQDDGSGATYEVLDGQQRTLSLCEYIAGNFSVDGLYFHNRPQDQQEAILQYPLAVYRCSGTPSEKLQWFQIVNIAGERLTDQEIRNAVYAGPWVSDAKRYFSKTQGPAYQIGNKYLKGSPVRQEYLETALAWIGNRDNVTKEDYMGRHQNDPQAVALWNYFQTVIDWVKAIFPVYRREMKGVPWGILYNANNERTDLDPDTLEEQVRLLMEDDDVTKKSGIYMYVLDGDESHLSIRPFTQNQKREAYERQRGICAHCHEHFTIEEMEGDHITPWSEGGRTVAENCQMLCKHCNRIKGSH